MPEAIPNTTTSTQTSSTSIPSEAVTCLENARFLHLATCHNNIPHVSLMNYTYLPYSPWTSHPTVVMTTPLSSKKTHNMLQNSRVSLLVHDWITHRPPTLTPHTSYPGMSGNAEDEERLDMNGTSPTSQGSSPPPPMQRSSLASLLLALNSSALSSISVTVDGTASLVPASTEEECWFKERHLANNTFDGEHQTHSEQDCNGFNRGSGMNRTSETGDGGRSCFIAGEDNRVVLVKIHGGKVADWKGQVREWSIESEESRASQSNGQ